MLAALLNYRGNQIFFTNMRFIDMLDRYILCVSYFMRALTKTFTPGIGK